VGGKAVFPVFAPGEQTANPKDYSDFNGLAVKSAPGRNGIERQLGLLLEGIFEQQRKRSGETRTPEWIPRQPQTLEPAARRGARL